MATWDVDPHLGHGISLSLLSAWKQFRYLQGQAFSGWTDLHLLSRDPKYCRRLEVKHELLRLALRSLYVAPEIVRDVLAPRNGPAPAVLDIGTGSGAWAIAMAKEFPHADVVGIDLESTTPTENPPHNCRFEIDDVNLSLDHYANCFDVIHVRQVDSGIHNYPRFLNQVAHMLRPGGVVLLVKAFHQLYSETCYPLPVNEEGDPGFTFLQKVYMAIYTAIKNRGGSEDAVFQYEYWLTQDPNYDPHKTVVRDLFIPIGHWAKDKLDGTSIQVCEMMRMNFQILMSASKPLLMGDGYEESIVDRWIAGAENELKTLSVKAYAKLRFAWAVRSHDDWVDTQT